ncbi:universal stress protein, UspA family [Formosa agariphila KMM 3901]|uniref:Universal stress protein, UspA family n=1 Tax=Formosa agariphila (strain DSM 15362 / KCTC 12365 / LMG 23005 / KMM 3901 / M-2Alg 35-1) TaxID=1347342 RepID=T2KH98_FORAG|nr:universal stress protein, UspA family [Formosa agariphila KMM 3901]
MQYAIDFAHAFGARLYLIQVRDKHVKSKALGDEGNVWERENLVYIDSLLAKVDTKTVDIVIKSFNGKLVQTLELICYTADIDLMLVQPKTNSVKESIFLGKTSGKIIKKTNIPSLIIPENYVFKPVTNVLIAIKSAIIKKESALLPLQQIQNQFQAVVNLLLVKTPFYKEGDFEIHSSLSALITETVYTEKATTFQGVLEHYNTHEPDLLCVFRRKRGFFAKMWEKNVILKKDFYSPFPVLVLKGVK